MAFCCFSASMTSTWPCQGRVHSSRTWTKSPISIPQRERWSSRCGTWTDITSPSARLIRLDDRDLPCRHQPSNQMAFPHPQARHDHDREEDVPGRCCIVRQDFERAIDIAGDRNGADDVYPAEDHAHD